MASARDATLWVVERLTIWRWLACIAPRLLAARLRGEGPGTCHVIDASRSALALARLMGKWVDMSVEPLAFCLIDIRDEAGLLVEERTRFVDLWEVRQAALAGPVGRRIQEVARTNPALHTYLVKGIAQDVCRLLWIIQVSAWRRDQLGHTGRVVLFADRRAWSRAAGGYAAKRGIALCSVPAHVGGRPLVTRKVGFWGRQVLRGLRNWSRRTGVRRSSAGWRIGVVQYRALHVRHPELNSDVFMWQQSSLAAHDLVVLLHGSVEPSDHEALLAEGISAVAMNRQAAAGSPWPMAMSGAGTLRRIPHAAGDDVLGLTTRDPEARWLRAQRDTYRAQRARWMRFFERERIKIFCSWFRFDAEHCAIADAIRSLGGVSTICQLSYASHPSPLTLLGTDVLFSWSITNAELERRAGVTIPYHVTTGYPGDHRFTLLRALAQEVRATLQRRGAKRIVAFFDETSHPDPRWQTGDGLQREGYAYLLERLLETPWLGVVFKPKTPGNLRHRLGPVVALLERAEATGRCYVYGTYRQGSAAAVMSVAAAPPAAAALAADVAVHCCLAAGTAGVEAALAGVPTLLMDREGWPISPLYRLGIGRVVFTDWDGLWRTCLEHWSRPGGMPGFGDWSAKLDELDPFRDGRAAERIGTYLQWLLEGFKTGLSRETILSDAAERYAEQWGKDKVTSVNTDAVHRAGVPSEEMASVVR